MSSHKRNRDESRNFCLEVPPGEYRLSALGATVESAPELLFLPPYADVLIKSPLFNVEFLQALVNVLWYSSLQGEMWYFCFCYPCKIRWHA